MGFFDSLLKSTVRKVVNEVVENAVDKAFNGNNNTTVNNNQQSERKQAYQQPQRTQKQITYGAPITLPQPNFTMEYERYTGTVCPCIITNDDDYDGVEYEFLKSGRLFETNSGAAEIDTLFMVAENEDEAYNDDTFDILPKIYLGDDLFYNTPSLKKEISDATFFKVENHPCIHEKQVFDLQHKNFHTGLPYVTHYIIYNFFVSDADRASNRSTSITLEFPANCTQDRRQAAMQAMDLLVASFIIK